MRRFLWAVLWSIAVVLASACGGAPRAAEPTSGMLFVSERDGDWEIYLIQPDASGLARLTEELTVDAGPTWSRDGRYLAFSSVCNAAARHLSLWDRETYQVE